MLPPLFSGEMIFIHPLLWCHDFTQKKNVKETGALTCMENIKKNLVIGS